MRAIPTHVVMQRGLCVCVCVLFKWVNTGRTAKPFEMMFGKGRLALAQETMN